MTIRHHPREETLLSYAAGTLVPALSAVVACHLAYCARCRADVRRMERIGAALLDRAGDAELSRKAVQRGLSRLADEGKQPPAPREEPARTTVASSVLPRPLALRLGMDIDEIPWKTLAPGIEQFKIKMPRRGGDLRLLRVQPGLKLLRHGHYGSELTLVLKGAYGDETGEYRTGEVADLDEDIEHRPKAGPGEECICIIAGERHPRYKSLAIRLLRPFLGF